MDADSALALMNADERKLITCSDDEWHNLIQYLLVRLETYFACKIVTEPFDNACVGRGFCLYVSSSAEAPDALMSWKGILGATIVDGRLYVSLTVFFYSGERRLVAKHGEGGADGRGGREFAEYTFESSVDAGCHWKLLDWFDDVYEEY